jgi:hypothetical protein
LEKRSLPSGVDQARSDSVIEADMTTDFPESKASWCCCRVEIHRYTSCWN